MVAQLKQITSGYFILISITLLFTCQSSTKSTLTFAETESEKTGCKNDEVGRFDEATATTKIETSFPGIDMTSLVADPTPEEIQLAWETVNQRDRSVKGLIEEDTFSLFLSGYPAMAKIVSHVVDSNRHYGGIIIPQTDEAQRLPVLVYLEGFGQQAPAVWINQNDLLLTHLGKDYWHKFIIVIPSYRGQTLYFNDSTNNQISYKSEGERKDAFDGAAEDALGLLNVALQTVKNVDKERILVMGGSRGGTVALLMAQRDPRIKWILNFVGPLDFIGRTLFQRTFDLKRLEDGLKSNYEVPSNFGEQHVYFFLEELKKGEASLPTARRKIIQSSPHYFAPKLAQAQMQLHYGVRDISFIQLQRFHSQIEELGLSCPQYEVYTYPKRGHDLVGDKPVGLRVGRFVNRMLQD